MTARSAATRHAVDACALHLRTWAPFLPSSSSPPPPIPYVPRKRRRRRSSSDRSGTRRKHSGASGAYATCSDLPAAAGTDSSGEMFDGNWGEEAGEGREGWGIEREAGGGWGGGGGGVGGGGEFGGSESETGYKGDAEVGYEDEAEEAEEEEDGNGRVLFWGDRLGDKERMELATKNGLPELKFHPRCRRKKNMMVE